MIAPLRIGVGGQTLVLTDAGPSLVMQHMKAALLVRRQEAVAERAYRIDIVPPTAAAAPSCRSRTEQTAFARALVTGALWTRGRMVECCYLVSDVCPRCLDGTDTVMHRTWECSESAPARALYRSGLRPDAADPFRAADCRKIGRRG